MENLSFRERLALQQRELRVNQVRTTMFSLLDGYEITSKNSDGSRFCFKYEGHQVYESNIAK